ncbi:MAG: tRNA (guanosine(46)-N7)-methyltransferase TrmB [Opitutaceae bacterium]|nr:tRNA (guanosine(46)-N7)-methyltransferase TrmB [Opitutaceae bacterium]
MPREVFAAIQAGRFSALRQELAATLPSSLSRLVLEIGCGNGHFLTAYAATHPDRFCVGVDLRLERIEKALRKRDRAGLANLHFIRCEARAFLRALPAGVQLLEVYMLFPDPWPKKRHHKNRLLKPEFLTEIATRAGQGSRLFFRTDYQPYYDDAAGIIAAHPQWRLLPSSPFPFEHQTIFQSRAETFHSLGAIHESSPVQANKLQPDE